MDLLPILIVTWGDYLTTIVDYNTADDCKTDND